MSHSQKLQQEYETTFKRMTELEKMIASVVKEARQALVITDQWNPEFYGQELVAVIALYAATHKVAYQKQAALTLAIDFIGQFENDVAHGKKAIEALEGINQILVGESIDESIQKQGENRGKIQLP